MIHDLNIKVTCPYCGQENLIRSELHQEWRTLQLRFYTCDNEIGGCDKTFAIQIELIPTIFRWELTKVKMP